MKKSARKLSRTGVTEAMNRVVSRLSEPPDPFTLEAARRVLERVEWHNDGMAAVTTRITLEPGKRGGQPCIRGLRITVWDIFGWLGAGMSEEQILDEHPDLEKEDFAAAYQFAAELAHESRQPAQ